MQISNKAVAIVKNICRIRIIEKTNKGYKMNNEQALENARNNQQNDYLDTQEPGQESESAEDLKHKVRYTFVEIADKKGLDAACKWLAGAFLGEAISNIAVEIIESDNDYISSLIETKAQLIAEGIE